MNDVKVSIIVPCYKVEPYLDRCVTSLVNQTLREIEIILVDDGSPDRVPQMCDEWAEKDSRIKVVHKQNAGAGYARNSGIAIATGAYIAFADSDDYIDAGAYRAAYEEVEKDPDIDAVFFGMQLHMPAQTKTYTVDERTEWIGEESIRRYMLDYIASPPHEKPLAKQGIGAYTGIYRRAIIETNHIRFPSERETFGEDFLFRIGVVEKCRHIVQLPACYYHYCYNNASLTHSFVTEDWGKLLHLYRNILMKKFGSDTEGLQRIDRFFIGFAVGHIIRLSGSEIPDKIHCIKSILNDPVWPEVKRRFRAGWLFQWHHVALHQYICLRLIYGKHPYLLYGASQSINFVKRFVLGQ